MWRIQVWQDTHIVEAFLCETEAEASAKEEGLRPKYPAPTYVIKLEEIPRRSQKWKKTSPIIGAIADAISNLDPPGH